MYVTNVMIYNLKTDTDQVVNVKLVPMHGSLQLCLVTVLNNRVYKMRSLCYKVSPPSFTRGFRLQASVVSNLIRMKSKCQSEIIFHFSVALPMRINLPLMSLLIKMDYL